MASWKKALSHMVINIEERYDLLEYRLRERLGRRNPLQILPYRGFGTQEVLYLKDCVLEDKGIKAASERDSLWDNLVNMYKRFNSKEIPYARVSASFQNIEQQVYDLLMDFFQLRNIPLSPLLLRDWGITEDEFVPARHDSHKLRSIRRILDLYSDLPFILVGDSGQEDPEIYLEVVAEYPGRILAVYIRNVSRSLDRAEEILAFAEEVSKVGGTMLLAEDTYEFARHAADHGWISPGTFYFRYFSQ